MARILKVFMDRASTQEKIPQSLMIQIPAYLSRLRPFFTLLSDLVVHVDVLDGTSLLSTLDVYLVSYIIVLIRYVNDVDICVFMFLLIWVLLVYNVSISGPCVCWAVSLLLDILSTILVTELSSLGFFFGNACVSNFVLACQVNAGVRVFVFSL